MDPLCKAVRRELRRRGVKGLEVLFSTEEPRRVAPREDAERRERTYVGTVSFVPPVAGLMLAGHVVRRVLGIEVRRATVALVRRCAIIRVTYRVFDRTDVPGIAGAVRTERNGATAWLTRT